MGMFEMSDEAVAEYRSHVHELARGLVDEPVVAAGVFRRGGAAAKMGISHAGVGALAYGAAALIGKRQAAGLPDKTLLVVTPTRLRAFKAKIKGRGFKAGDEVASWDRAGMEVTPAQTMDLTMLNFEAADGSKVSVAPVGVRDDPVSLEVIRVLTEGETAPAA